MFDINQSVHCTVSKQLAAVPPLILLRSYVFSDVALFDTDLITYLIVLDYDQASQLTCLLKHVEVAFKSRNEADQP